MLGLSMLLVTTCIVAQEPATSKRPMETPTKQAPATTQETSKPGSENKSNAVVFKGAGNNQTSRDANKARGRSSNEKTGSGQPGNGGSGKTGNGINNPFYEGRDVAKPNGRDEKSKASDKNATKRDRPKDIPN